MTPRDFAALPARKRDGIVDAFYGRLVSRITAGHIVVAAVGAAIGGVVGVLIGVTLH